MAATDAAIVWWAVGPSEREDPGTTGRAAAVAAVLDRLDATVRRGRRVSLVLTGANPPTGYAGGLGPGCVPPGAAGSTVFVPGLCAALHRAATLLGRAGADLALVAAELDDEPGRWLVVALRRLAESWSPDEPPLTVVRPTDELAEADRLRCDALRASDLRRMLADGCRRPHPVADRRPPTPVALPEPSRRGRSVLLLPPPLPVRPPGDPLLVRWSARNEVAEERLRRALGRLAAVSGDLFGDERRRVEALARCAPRWATPDGVRGAVVAAGAAELAGALRRHRPVVPRRRPVALLFPGQGTQYPRMGAGLYRHDPVFTAAMDTFFTLWGDGGDRLREEWLAGDPDVDDASRAQPLLLGVGHALGAMVRSWGVRPVALLGHSAGELVAATLAGTFSLPAAVRLMRARVTEVVRTPPGGMLAVAAAADELRPYLTLDPTGQVAVAAVNAPRQTLLAGPVEALATVREKLREQGYVCRPARARQAFHSPAVLAASLATRPVVEAVRPGPPVDALYSAYTGRQLDAATAVDPMFWTTQYADPVLFWPALDALLAGGDLLLLEVGAGQGLTTLARQHRAVRSRASDAVALLPASPGEPEADRRSVLAAAARIWDEGHELRWEVVDGTPARR